MYIAVLLVTASLNTTLVAKPQVKIDGEQGRAPFRMC
jgi:hypothetical protein